MVEFDHFRKEAGLPTFTMSVSNWVESTNAKGIFSVKGRYGGTYAHRDIAFEFGSAISPIFKLHIIKEYQRLKEIESDKYGLEWDVRRILNKHLEKYKSVFNKSGGIQIHLENVKKFNKIKELFLDELEMKSNELIKNENENVSEIQSYFNSLFVKFSQKMVYPFD